MKLGVSPSERDFAIHRDPNTQVHISLRLLHLLVWQSNHGLGIDANSTLFTRLH